ncbi:hypothetical protein [Maricaulis sp.]|uniref:hypothetical protein n=1 Tax=Maricaulis sp. TaxID=1486257 RepID=UPI00262BA690|nr:hypothetical protein [Maricaulis sp.]
MRNTLIVIAFACALPATGQAQTFSEQEPLNIEAQITELENLSVTKQSDLDFGDIDYLVTDISGTGTYGWSGLPVIVSGGSNLVCDPVSPTATGMEVIQNATTSGAGIVISTDESGSITVSFAGVLDPATDPHLILTRSGGAETLRVGSMKYNAAFLTAINTLVAQTTRTTFADWATTTNNTGVLGLCIYGEAELSNGLTNGIYSTTFDVTATYN